MNLGTYLDQKVERYRDRPFLFYYDAVLSYGELGAMVDRLANGLRELGVRAGDFVHVMVPNSPETLASYFAIQKLGAVAGPINGQWKAKELEYLLNDSRGRALIIGSAHVPELAAVRQRCPALEIVVEVGDRPAPGHHSLAELLTRSPSTPIRCAADERDAAYIFYTSGTTGTPKGVLLSHRNVLADIRSFQDGMQLEEGYRILVFLPLFHVNAMMTSVSTLDRGGAVVLRKQFSAQEFWPTVERYRPNFFSAVPAVYAILLANPDIARHDKSSLWFGICGAAPMPVETLRAFERGVGLPIIEGYGLTEATCVSTLNPRVGARKVGSIGLPCPGQEVLVVDERGQEVGPGERGEIVIRGDVVMMGYHNRPDETHEALRGGMLHTGDVGTKDQDGYLFILDRLKDLVIRGGENIYPKEIDDLLSSHPGIREAACVGVPDPILGEELKAYVVLAPGAALDAEQIRSFCRQHLAAYKVPKDVEILSGELPRNAVGKVMKQELRRRGVTASTATEATASATEAASGASATAPVAPASVADIFASMAERARPDALAGLTARFGYRITGEGGGEWTVVVANGTAAILAGLQQPNVTTTMAAQDFVELNLGKLDGMTAFSTGKLVAEGDVSLLAKAPKLFKKYRPPSEREAGRPPAELVVLRQLLSLPQRFTTGPLMGKFLAELRDHRRILGNKCPSCGRIQTPPREVCAVCRVRVDELCEVGPEGEVVSYDITYYASPDPLTGESRDTPYCPAFFVLDGCGRQDVFWHEVNPAHIDRLRKGARVRAVWAAERTGSITDIRYFDVVDAAGCTGDEAPAPSPALPGRSSAAVDAAGCTPSPTRTSSTLTAGPADSFVVEGKLALPYRYFAGQTGSRFLCALRDEQTIFGNRCPRCDKVFVPPRLTCERHPTEMLSEWIPLSGAGVVTGFTVVRYEEPYQPAKPPYILALVKLDGADISPSEMRVGLRLKAVFAKAPTSTILDIDHFAPAQAVGKPAYPLGLGYDELELGMSATFSKTITETDVVLFAGISGDFNPLHVNEEYAKSTPFGRRIAHGALPQCLIAPVLGMKLPGQGTIALEMNVRFKAPTYFGDTITAKATVAEKLPDKRWVRMDCEWTNQRGQLIAAGWALVMPPTKP